MFGHRFFGARYYGPSYWGDGGNGGGGAPDAIHNRRMIANVGTMMNRM